MYVASGTADWLGRVAVVTGGALPATLLWLVLGCSFKRLLKSGCRCGCRWRRAWYWARWPVCMRAAC